MPDPTPFRPLGDIAEALATGRLEIVGNTLRSSTAFCRLPGAALAGVEWITPREFVDRIAAYYSQFKHDGRPLAFDKDLAHIGLFACMRESAKPTYKTMILVVREGRLSPGYFEFPVSPDRKQVGVPSDSVLAGVAGCDSCGESAV